MYTQSEFISMIDDMTPEDIQTRVANELSPELKTENPRDWTEVSNIIESARVATIKDKISKTHKWSKAICGFGSNRNDTFWCHECNLRASVFDHIATLSIISKVNDNLPSYTVHNEYLMLTCDAVKALKTKEEDDYVFCSQCGVPEKGKTINCEINK